jgi:FMN phosphatase YigB (HAD superfamily)
VAGPIDLVCWDFGDTLVHERFMRRCPPGVPEWEDVYDGVVDSRAEWVTDWMLGRAAMTDLIPWLAAELPMTRTAVARHLRAVWQQIEWFPESREWVEQLNGRVAQAVVTVNPAEFSGIATACGLDPLVDVIVTSADLDTPSKVAMAEHVRWLLGLGRGVSTSLLIDNREDNIDEFAAADGHGYHFTPDGFGRDAEALLGPLL